MTDESQTVSVDREAALAPAEPVLPRLADRYQLEAEIGRGGMGRVYRARDLSLGRAVAVKLLAPGRRGEVALHRFGQEARAAGALNHPNVLSVHDIGEHEGAPFIVSELLDGQTLRGKLAGRALPLRKVLDLAGQLARGLTAAHEKGIVHRDLKPENLFVCSDGRLKILDFGIAKLGGEEPVPADAPVTAAGTVIGTVGYMSPEQVRGEEADDRSDLFSFGAILYELLAGARAFERPTGVEISSAILNDEPQPLPAAVPEQLRRVVQRCLEKDPAERFQSARDLAFLLEGITGTSGARPALLPARRTWLRPLLGGALLLALGLLLGWRLATPPPAAEVRFRQLSQGHLLVDSSRFTPDGASVVYSGAQAGEHGFQPWAIWTTRLDQPRPHKLLDDAMVRSVSAPGELLVLLHPKKGNTSATGTLARMPLAGGAPLELAHEVEDADWLPDGSSWALTRTSGIGKRSLEFPAGKVVFETPGSLMRVRVSPDGRHVAFFDQPVAFNDSGFVAVATRDGQVRRLTPSWFTADGLAWNGNDELWFSANNSGVYAVKLDGALRQVHAAHERLVVEDLRAGKALLHSHHQRKVVAVHLPDGSTREVGGSDYLQPVDIGPDGTVLLDDEGDEVTSSGGAALALRPGANGPIRLGDGHPMMFSPDYKSALVIEPGPPQRLTVRPTGAGEARQVPFEPGLVYATFGGAWFPDGKRLLLVAGRQGEALHYGWQEIGEAAFHPMGEAESFSRFFVSPDGTTIASGPGGGVLRLTTLDGVVRDLDPPAKVSGGIPRRWSSDGRVVYMGRDGSGNRPATIRAVDVATGASTDLLTVEVPSGSKYVRIKTISEDGRAWAYEHPAASAQLLLAENLR